VRPTLSFYRYLYDAVGGPWLWTERRLMPDADLARLLHDDRVEVHVLWAGGVPAGYAELDRRDRPDLQLAYFGLVPEFVGHGLGRYLLDQAVALAWRRMPARVWVHTCDLDHPRALPLYREAGFAAYAERVEHVRLPPS
jgi:GNAT superfamily N-acetyltransferase